MTEEEIENRCTIGQSNGISETLFSKGFQISRTRLNNVDNAILEDLVFCDNPGFNDTRGTSYDICTNLSMDRAVEVCKSIKAIVLLVPYETLVLDRGNHIVNLM